MNLFRIILSFIIIFLTACDYQIETNMSEPMVDFDFITQDAKTLSSNDLEDQWWIANLMYTNCRTICPRTTANMVDVQQKLKDDGLTPQIVSFSIDPSHDTPKILEEYANDYDVDLKTWDFLTGYDFVTIKNISEKTFKSVLEKGAVGQRSHGYGFYLIDPDGIIVKKYDGMSTNELNDLVEDLKKVLSKT